MNYIAVGTSNMKLIRINESQKYRLFEAYNSDLYHFTNLEGIEGILSSNCLSAAEDPDEETEVLCFSRTKNPYIGYSPFGNLIYRITIDTNNALSSIRNFKTEPWSNNNPKTKRIGKKYFSVSDFEERSYASVYPLNKYCKSIDVFTQNPNDWIYQEDVFEIQNLINEFPQWRNYFHIFGNNTKKIDIETILKLDRTKLDNTKL